MRWMEEYREAGKIDEAAALLSEYRGPAVSLMEICGGQTHTIVKYGLENFLPPGVTLVHGPGCPVCVTPIEKIEQAQALAARPDVILCTFGDMMRVPGRSKDLRQVKAEGGDIRVLYSPLEALRLAKRYPQKEVIFFSVGFETTAPATAMTVIAAKNEGFRNLSFLISHVLVPPAIEAIVGGGESTIQGFLLAGHVCTVMGVEEYQPLAQKYRLPLVVTGFEPLDLLQGIVFCLRQIQEGRAEIENQYSRSVRWDGNQGAKNALREVFTVVDRAWRGIGVIPKSGYRLAPAFSEFDAEIRFPTPSLHSSIALGSSGQALTANLDPTALGSRVEGPRGDEGLLESEACKSGLVLQGKIKPPACPMFGKICTPDAPLGAPMVSSEGACAAYYLYKSQAVEESR